MMLLLLVATNAVLQLNRRYFDILNDGTWGFRRLQTCERLGRVPDVLFTGNSRTVFGADASLIDSTLHSQFGVSSLSCNMGIMASSYEEDYYMLKRVLGDGYVPKLVVEFVPGDSTLGSLTAFRLADIGDITQWEYDNGLPGIGERANFAAQKLVPLIGDRVGILRALCGASRVGPCSADTTELAPFHLQNYEKADRQGWVGFTDWTLAQIPQQTRDAWLDAVRQALKSYRPCACDGNLYLERFIQLAHAHHVPVALVIPPLHSSFFPLVNWPQQVAGFQELADAQHVTLYDESQASGYTDADFYDQIHLAKAGAEKLSAWLAMNLVAPRLVRGT
jgi:hypothetical protein